MAVLLIRTIDFVINLLSFLILIRIVVSFVRIDTYNRYYRILYQLTEPILEPIRKLIYKMGIDTGMFDFSPLIASILLYYVVKPLAFYIILIFTRLIP